MVFSLRTKQAAIWRIRVPGIALLNVVQETRRNETNWQDSRARGILVGYIPCTHLVNKDWLGPWPRHCASGGARGGRQPFGWSLLLLLRCLQGISPGPDSDKASRGLRPLDPTPPQSACIESNIHPSRPPPPRPPPPGWIDDLHSRRHAANQCTQRSLPA